MELGVVRQGERELSVVWWGDNTNNGVTGSRIDSGDRGGVVTRAILCECGLRFWRWWQSCALASLVLTFCVATNAEGDKPAPEILVQPNSILDRIKPGWKFDEL